MTEPRLTPASTFMGTPVKLTQDLTSYYTSTGGASVVDQCTCINTTNMRALVTMHLVPAGMEPGDLTLVVVDKTIKPFESYVCAEVCGHVLMDGDSLQAECHPDGAVILRVSGRTGV